MPRTPDTRLLRELREGKNMVSQPPIDLQTFLINKGRGYSIPFRAEDVGDDDSIYVFVDNPDGSGHNYDVLFIPRADGMSDIDVSYDATEGDAGETNVEENLKPGTDRDFSGTTRVVQSDDSGEMPSHGTTLYQDFVPGSGRGSSIGGQVINSVATTIAEGGNRLIELNNVSGGEVDRLSLNVVLFEVDGTYKEIE